MDVSLPSSWRTVAHSASSKWTQSQTGSRFRVGAWVDNNTGDYIIVSAGARRDFRNVVAFGPLSPEKLGECQYWTGSTGQIIDSDIVLNSTQPLVLGESSGQYDVYSILVHEFGHFCGLGHVDDRTHSMYSYGHDNSTIGRTLCSGDIAGVRALYP
jgi:hypothetical protein